MTETLESEWRRFPLRSMSHKACFCLQWRLRVFLLVFLPIPPLSTIKGVRDP